MIIATRHRPRRPLGDVTSSSLLANVVSPVPRPSSFSLSDLTSLSSPLLTVGLALLAGVFIYRYMQVTAPPPKPKARRKATKLGLGTVIPTVALVGVGAYAAGKYFSA